ncbi:AAA family ATPase [Fimbriiglobus ruber]|nr:AAA family ATPase [Fimbriiglobus ruber]
MFIEKLSLRNVRTFLDNELIFLHPETTFRTRKQKVVPRSPTAKLLPKPKLTNVNLLLGDNASGKTTVLQSIALSSLGPAARESQIGFRPFVRVNSPSDPPRQPDERNRAFVTSSFLLHSQDYTSRTQLNYQPGERVEGRIRIHKEGELESIHFVPPGQDDDLWQPVYRSSNDSFFCVAYGATRRVDLDQAGGQGPFGKTSFLRGQRVQSVFQEAYQLYPLQYWLPALKGTNRKRFKQIIKILSHLLKSGSYSFDGKMREDEYVFSRGGTAIKFQNLSDGYRAFIGWVADLLYHMSFACPPDKSLLEMQGVVMVDEIDLHLHPRWQMKVVRTIAKTFPNLQFIFTSHSPLVASSLEWMNIITLKTSPTRNVTKDRRFSEGIHGLDADQVLISNFFGLATTRTDEKASRLDRLTERAREGDDEAAKKVIEELATGSEDEEWSDSQ